MTLFMVEARKELINGCCTAEVLATVWAAVGLEGEYLHRQVKAVAHTQEALGLLMFAAAGVCPDSAKAYGTCARCAEGFKEQHGNHPDNDDGEAGAHFFSILEKYTRAQQHHAEHGDEDVGDEVRGTEPQ